MTRITAEQAKTASLALRARKQNGDLDLAERMLDKIEQFIQRAIAEEEISVNDVFRKLVLKEKADTAEKPEDLVVPNSVRQLIMTDLEKRGYKIEQIPYPRSAPPPIPVVNISWKS